MNNLIALDFTDWLIIGLYFLVLSVWGILLAKARDLDDFLIHKGSTRFILLIGSSLTTLVGAGTIFSIFELGYYRGMIVIGFGLAFSLGLFITAAIAPRIKDYQQSNNIRTLPEFLAVRYSGRCARLAGILNLVAFLFFAAAQFLVVRVLISYFTGIDGTSAVLVVGLIVVLYTMSGGLRSDFVTDFIQFVIMVLILVAVFVYLSGGLNNESIFQKTLNLGTYERSTWNDLGFVLGAFFLLAPSFPVAMDIWQRILAAQSVRTAKRFLVTCALLILGFFFGFGLLGMYSSGSPLNGGTTTNLAISKMFEIARAISTELSFPGTMGFFIVGFLAALQSTLGSMLLVSSISLTSDILGVLDKGNDRQKLWTSRIGLLVIGSVAMFLAISFENVTTLVANALASLAILFLPVMYGLFSKHDHEVASFWSILIGFSLLIILLFILGDSQISSVVGVIVSWLVFAFQPKFSALLARKFR